MVAILLLPIYMQEIFFEPLYYQEKAIELSLYYVGIIMIPWSAKLIFGLLSDNVGFGKFGRRKPYFVFAGVFGIIGWVCLPLFGSFNWLFIIVGILVSLCVAISDAILDSLAVDITPQKRRGAMQGVGWGGRGLGMAVAGYFLGIIIANDDAYLSSCLIRQS
jgi:MFS family permease